MRIREYVVKGISDIVAACPYTILGRKVLGHKRPTEGSSRCPVSFSEHKIIQRVKLGRNIALIGVFCPFFWIALFSGASWDMVYFNATHSGIVIAIGFLILIKGRIDLVRYKRMKRD